MRKALFCILLLLSVLPAGARRYPRYPFVRTDRNTIQIPGGKAPELYQFYRKLDTLLVTGRGDVRILHVGGSHVQGGTMSERVYWIVAVGWHGRGPGPGIPLFGRPYQYAGEL